jgi:cupin fold WbuC family metalloprotein
MNGYGAIESLDLKEIMNSSISKKCQGLVENPLKNTKREAEEVIYPNSANISLRNNIIPELCKEASLTTRGRLRFCLHTEIENALHEMLIVHPYRTYVPPHKHHNQSESIIILEGIMDVVIFNKEGLVERVIPMGTFDSGRVFHNRLEIPEFHTMLIHSDQVVFTEIKTGPYIAEMTEIASWAPDTKDSIGVKKFLDKLFTKHKTVN